MEANIKKLKAPKIASPRKKVIGIIAFTLLIILSVVAYYVALNSNLFSTMDEHDTNFTIDQTNPKLENNVTKTTDENLSQINEGDNSDFNIESIISFAPNPNEDKSHLNPYDEFVDAQKTIVENSITLQELENKINNYRLYLANANELIIKFLRHENYTNQLDGLRAIKLPNEITEIVKIMEEHLTFFGKKIISKQIFPTNSKAVEKFIKVVKTNEAFINRTELESRIKKELTKFTTYIYSAEVQEQFLGNVVPKKSFNNGGRHD